MSDMSPQVQTDLFSVPSVGNHQTGTALSKPKALRLYQKEAIRKVYSLLGTGTKRVCLVAPTGAGKTILSSSIVSDARSRGRRVAFCVPAISLIDQTVEVFEAQGLGPIGVQQADHNRTDSAAPIQVCSVQTLVKRGIPDGIDVVLIDEAHVKAKAVQDWMAKQPDTMFVGMTATPGRAGMRDEYDALVVSTDIGKLMDDGFLSRYRVFAPSAPDMSKARKVAGDYHKGDVSDAMDDPKLTADIVATWLEKGYGLPTLLFAADRAHAKRLQSEFEAEGITCGYQDAFTDPIERKFIAGEFEAGRMQIVANVGTLTTGVDWDVRCVILARPTQSKMLHIQIIGRGLRTADGKDHCIILDHAGNIARLGFPEHIDWSEFPQKGKEKGKVERKEPMPKTCGDCSFVMPPKSKACPNCGKEIGPPSGFIETEEGDLVEVGADGKVIAPKPREYSTSDKQSWHDQLSWIARERSRSPGWVAHTYKKKFGVWPRKMAPGVCPAGGEVLSFVRHCDIAYAKSKGAEQ